MEVSAHLRRRLAGRATRTAVVLMLVAVAGCSADSASETPAERPSASPTATGPKGPMLGDVDPRMCRRPVNDESRPGADIKGRAVDATLWALPFATLPFRAGKEVKIVWRMTGAGPPRFTVVGPAGADPRAIQWGPEAHAGSTWNRPGEEWGTGIRFARPGCWRVTVSRDRGIGAVWFTVA